MKEQKPSVGFSDTSGVDTIQWTVAKLFQVSLHDLIFGSTTLKIHDYPRQLALAAHGSILSLPQARRAWCDRHCPDLQRPKTPSKIQCHARPSERKSWTSLSSSYPRVSLDYAGSGQRLFRPIQPLLEATLQQPSIGQAMLCLTRRTTLFAAFSCRRGAVQTALC
jgi:hypothetical protein